MLHWQGFPFLKAPRRFTKLVAILLSLGVSGAATTSAHGVNSSGQQDESELARIGEESIDLGDLQSQIASELRAAEFVFSKKRHELIEHALKAEVRQRLLERFSEEEGVSSSQYMEEQVHAKATVSDADVDEFYQQNKARMQGRTLEQIAPQIRDYLQSEARAKAESEFYAGLEKRYEVHYGLEPFRVEILTEGFPVTGPEDARVTLVEFSDFQCPFCSQFNATLDLVKEQFPDDVRLVFRQFPLAMHAEAQKAAEASLCARDQGKFWEMHDLMFADQKQLGVEYLKAKATRLELDSEAFVKCLDSDQYRDQVLEDLADGAAVGVSGTPALFVNGRPLDGGAVPLEDIAEMIREELNR